MNITWQDVPLKDVQAGDYHEGWCTMPPDAGEGEVLTGTVVEVLDGSKLVVRSAVTGRLYTLYHDGERVIESWPEGESR